MMDEVLIRVRSLRTWFPVAAHIFGRRRGSVKAVDDVSLEIRKGEVFGLVGESGSGKTTLGRSLLCLVQPSGGSIEFNGTELIGRSDREMRSIRRQMQIIYQDPYASLDPRMSVGAIVAEGMAIHRIGTRASRRERVQELLEMVGLTPDHASRYPHEFSGGQRQRIGIARALSVNPSFIVADEPVSALDVSIQAQIINLLHELRKTLNLTLLFISHDLSVVGHFSNRVAVMYLGRVMEIADRKTLFSRPRHPYTAALLSAVPIANPRRDWTYEPLAGDIPSPVNPPSGCVFRTRCPYAIADCAKSVPPLREVAVGHETACIREEIL